MAKNIIKRYFINLKWIWIPFVLFSFFLIIGVLVIYISGNGSFHTLISASTEELADKETGNAVEITNYLNQRLAMLSVDQGLDHTFQVLFTTSWFGDTFVGLDQLINNNYAASSAALSTYEETCKTTLLTGFGIGGGIIVLGISITDFVSTYIIYGKNLYCAVYQTVLEKLIEAFLIAAIITFATFLTVRYNVPVVLSALLILVLNIFLSLVESWIVMGKGKVRFDKAINRKVILSTLLGEMVVYSIFIGVTILLYYTLGSTISLLMIIPLLIYTNGICSISFDAHIDNIRRHKKF